MSLNPNELFEQRLLNSVGQKQLRRLKAVATQRRMLVKKGRVLKRKTKRYCEFQVQTLQYYTSMDTRTVKGTVNHHCAVAVSVNSPVRAAIFAVKVALWTTEFYLVDGQ